MSTLNGPSRGDDIGGGYHFEPPSATRQIARGQRDSSAITESAQAEVRPLGSLEHLFWLLDQHRFVHFAVTALISGETTPRDWRRALDRLQKRHPILSVCIDGKPDSVPSFRQADVTPIPLRDSLMDGQEQDQAGAAMPAVYRPHDNARPTVKGLRLSPGLTSSIRARA